jgi:hypothetical protein
MVKIATASHTFKTDSGDSYPAGLPAIPRRILLGSIAAGLGLFATPAAVEPLAVVQHLLDPPAPSNVIQAGAIEWSWKHDPGDWSVMRYFPNPEHAENSFRWRNRKPDGWQYRVVPVEMRFAGSGRRFLAVKCAVDLPPVEEGDEPTGHEGIFEPRHLLDWPRVAPDCGKHDEGRLWDGLEVQEYMDTTELTSREDAMQAVAAANDAALEHEPCDTMRVFDGGEWWVVIEIGLPFKISIIDVELTNGVGKAEVRDMDFACRIVEPTAAEVSRFGKAVAL